MYDYSVWYTMLTKLDDRTRQWLIPDDHHEIVTLVSDTLGEWGSYNEHHHRDGSTETRILSVIRL